MMCGPRRLEYLLDVKRGYYDLNTARVVANTAINNVIRVADAFAEKVENKGDPEVDDILDGVQYGIMRQSVANEFLEDEVYD